MIASNDMQEYFDLIEKAIDTCYLSAELARKMGFDPEDKVDIPLARGISQRVEGLISAVSPQILKSGVAEQIEALEKEYGSLDWRVALRIAEDVAKQKFCKFNDEKEAMEVAIRVGLAYITLGVIAAPLEGFIELKLKNTKDGSGQKYFSCFFAGPIRAAGGTAAAVTALIADYVRIKMGYAKYDPTENEIKRYIAEIVDYHERITNLQYFPSEKEIEFLAKHLTIEINGDPTEELEVSNFKGLDRVETDKIRGGMCLVMAEGIAQKSPKMYKQIAKWGKSMGIDWEWMKEFLELQKIVKAKGKISDDHKEKPKITPNFTYIKDLVAGRPVLSYPLTVGGFRLRYGRTRTSGFAADSIHPATMLALDDYIATGTQLKVERPGKATVLSPCDYIDGPIIKLNNGDVLKIDSEEEIKPYLKDIKKILFLGDLLVNYGDFSENNHSLVPAGYCEEWWIQEVEKKCIEKKQFFNSKILSELTGIEEDFFEKLISNPIKTKISFNQALIISKKLDVALHPNFIYYYNNLSKEELKYIIDKKKEFQIVYDEGIIKKIIIKKDENLKKLFEKIGIPHKFVSNEFIVFEKEIATSFYKTIGEDIIFDLSNAIVNEKNALTLLNTISHFIIKDKLGTFIGTRMGRPEKAKERALQGSPHVLFPIGEEGGKLKTFQAAMEKGFVTADFPLYRCDNCNKQTIMNICENCESKTTRLYNCRICGLLNKKCTKVDEKGEHYSVPFKEQTIDIKYYFEKVIKKSKLKQYPELIKGVKGTSNKNHEPEHLIKGILRAKHNIHVNKDGTTRYDMIEMPITHFKPCEIGVSYEKIKSLGYKKDIYGKEITNDNQIIELFCQDLILPDAQDSPDEFSSEVLIRICQFIDDLLTILYNQKPFYNVKRKEDLLGLPVIGLAPHTSAGMVGRILGFSKTQGMYCHPYFHAAMRRNCDGDEACVLMLMDAFLNFSRTYLPDRRGSRTMDAPLVLTSLLIPAEVDSEVHGIDVVWRYPLELYEAALEYKSAGDVKIKQIVHTLGKIDQYEGMGFTHHTTDLNAGVRCSAYKTLPSMEDKLKGQMMLAEKIVAVDESDVARLVIEKHFMKDIKGNLRKFSQQEFRCVGCNEKYRRPPLVGVCTECGGKIIFTISEGSIVKYLEPAISLAQKYDVSPYLKESLELVKRRVEDVFGKEAEKQTGLGAWFG